MKIWIATLCFFMSCLPFMASAQLRPIKGKYELTRFEIGKAERKGKEALNSKYVRAMTNLRERLKKQGDLDGVIMVDEELKRFGEMKDVGSDVGVSKIKIMNEMFAGYRMEIEGIALVIAKKRLEWASGYYKQLVAEETRLVKANDIAEAKKVREEKDRLVSDPELARAKTLVAAANQDKRSGVAVAPPASPIGSAIRVKALPSFLQKGLVLHVSFDEASTAGMKDGSASKAPVQIKGGKVSAEAKVGRALQLGGGTDRVEVEHVGGFALPGECTLAMWIKLDDWEEGGGLCSKGTGGGNESLLLDVVGGKLRFIRWNQQKSAYVQAQSSAAPRRGVWQHIAAVSDGEYLRVYVDGKAGPGGPIKEPCLINTASFHFGARPSGAKKGEYHAVSGLMDELMIYNRALSDKEIRALMKVAD